MKRILVYEYLSGGGPVEGGPEARDALLPAGRAMRDAIVADLLRAPDCAVTVATPVPLGTLPGRAASIAPRDGEAPEDFVARAAHGHDLAWIVAPESCGLLGDLHRRIGGARWIGCGADAIALATSKRATAAFLAARGLLTPAAFEHDPRTRRWVVKPDDGAGAVATHRHDDLAAARAEFGQRLAAGEAVVLEPWVDGDAMSLSLLCGADGAELLSVNRQEIGVDAAGRVGFDGVALDVMAPSDPRRVRLARLAQAVADAVPGLRGFVGIDFVWHPAAGPVVVEINPRVTCAYVGLSAALGRNLGADVIAAHTEREAIDAVR